jgi:hypothetical protein
MWSLEPSTDNGRWMTGVLDEMIGHLTLSLSARHNPFRLGIYVGLLSG